MSAFDTIKKTIADLPISDIYKARIELAFDQLADAQRQVSDLQTQVGRLESERDRERLERQQAQRDLHTLREEHAEEVRIHHLVELRRGKRTGGRWQAFCPQCHMPAGGSALPSGQPMAFCTGKCGWSPRLPMSLESVIGELDV